MKVISMFLFLSYLNFASAQMQDTLQEVEIISKSSSRELEESPNSVNVIETKPYYHQSVSLNQLINRSSGLHVRQEGGLGSRIDISVNGISGKQVKYFLDGIPMDYLGQGIGIATLPVNTIERVEIYKGLVPAEFGADALGGAINIVSRKDIWNYADASYSTGSFNTHRATLGIKLQGKQHAFVSFNGFYNYSDNNYKIDASIPDQFFNPQSVRINLFHNRFRGFTNNLEVGIRNRKNVDFLSLSVLHSQTDKQIQNNVIMTQPYGAANYCESALNTAIKYKKYNVFKNTDVNVYGGFNMIKGLFTDTTLNVYTWDGKVFVRKSYGGEISSSRNLLNLKTYNGIARTNIVFRPAPGSLFNLNVLCTYFTRSGYDTVAEKYYKYDYFKHPTSMFKTVGGISFQQQLLNSRFTSITTIKFFGYKAQGFIINNNLKYIPIPRQQQSIGYSEAMKWMWTSGLISKISYEYAIRLPDEQELFGDYMLLKANPGLLPEQSHNINGAILYSAKKLGFTLSAFYRNINNIIYLRSSQFFSQFQNLLSAEIRGVEGEINYKPITLLSFTANATWQSTLNKSKSENSGVTDNKYYNLQLPNIPVFFANAGIQLNKDKFLLTHANLQLWWSCGYVKSFYLYWSIDGTKDSKAEIPEQISQNAGISYSIFNGNYAFSLDLQNITSNKLFDNYSVQLPGRAIYFKIRAFINRNLKINN